MNADIKTDRINKARAQLGGQLRYFIPQAQRFALSDLLLGEEAEYFALNIINLAERIEKMPKTYEQDGLGDEAIAHLRYFHPTGFDWHITEKDMGDGTGDMTQHQAFGLADMGSPELGYISIAEMIDTPGVELDLYHAPRTIREIRAEKEV